MAKVQRLLDLIRPEIYHLRIAADFSDSSFQVNQKIDFELLEPADNLTFHAVGLDITDAQVNAAPVKDIIFQPKEQTVTFLLPEKLSSGKHSLALTARGKLADALHGFYRSTYESEGKVRNIATTQFEAVHAREALVCIDEPAAKAIFNVELVAPKDLIALSNTNVLERHNEGELTRHVFAPTPRMSSYLLAFVIGDFEYSEAATPEGVIIRVYATPGKKDQTSFALQAAIKTLSFYTSYFAIDYPLPKLDMVAIPDFGAGAMENWGLVTYRETALLIDEENSGIANKQRVAVVVAHELAHQWFGNLVTMSWWEDLWLNEGFASWIEYLAVDHIFPEWEMWTQFVTDDYARALELDSLRNTHPIQVEVEDPRSLDEIFDAVSYSKGASIIRMLQSYLGADEFQKGLQIYLKRHAYANTQTNDLWQALSEASGQPVSEIMSAWTSQAGFPVLQVMSIEENITATQNRFFSSPLEAKKLDEKTLWPIPLSYMTDVNETQHTLMKDVSLTLPVAEYKWLKINPGQVGFFRTHYDSILLNALLVPLSEQQLDPIDRFGLISDVSASVEAGLAGSNDLLTLISTLRTETSYAVWNVILSTLAEMRNLELDATTIDALDAFAAWLVQPQVERLGWEAPAEQSHFDKLLRPLVLLVAGRGGNKNVISTAQKLFSSTESIPADLRGTVYTLAAMTGGEDEYVKLKNLYEATDNQQEKMRLLRGLSSFKQSGLLQKTLDYGMSDKVRSQDTIYPLSFVGANRYGSEIAWQFMQNQWAELVRRYGEGGHMLQYLPEIAAGGFATEQKASEIEDFFGRNSHPAIVRPVKQAVERVRLKADWRSRDEIAITAFLKGFTLK